MIGGVKVDDRGRTTLPGSVGGGRSDLQRTCTAPIDWRRTACSKAWSSARGKGASATAPQDAGRSQAMPLENPPVEPSTERLDLADIRNSLKSLVWRAAGVRRDGEGLRDAARTIDGWQRYALAQQFADADGWELQNMLTVARVMIAAAFRREESRRRAPPQRFPEAGRQALEGPLQRRPRAASHLNESPWRVLSAKRQKKPLFCRDPANHRQIAVVAAGIDTSKTRGLGFRGLPSRPVRPRRRGRHAGRMPLGR